ncbi:MAG: NADH-quinone oxidoreductase subunit N [Gammaproteobacteria bacterium]
MRIILLLALELTLLAVALKLLLVDAFWPALRKNRFAWMLTCIVCFVLAFIMGLGILKTNVISENLFKSQWIIDPLAYGSKFLIALGGGLVALYMLSYWGRWKLSALSLSLYLMVLLGLMGIVSAQHAISLYLSIELMSLPLYVLIVRERTVNHHISAWSLESGMKYLVLGAVASAILLFGFSLMYGITHHLDLQEWSRWMIEHPNLLHSNTTDVLFLLVGLIGVLTGICFKLGLFPFHFWLPDVYQGSVYGLGLVFSALPKIAGFVMAYRLITVFNEWAVVWQWLLLLIGMLSVLYGNIVAILQNNVKRLLAYSAIANMGFVILGMIPIGLKNKSLDFSASFSYLIIYGFSIILVFGVLGYLSKINNQEIQRLEELKGLSKTHPYCSGFLLLSFLSLIGIPPLFGFYAKYAILNTLLQQQFVLIAVLIVLASVVAAYYYLRIIWFMYFEENVNPFSKQQSISNSEKLFMLHAFAIVYFSINPDILFNFSQYCFRNF